MRFDSWVSIQADTPMPTATQIDKVSRRGGTTRRRLTTPSTAIFQPIESMRLTSILPTPQRGKAELGS